MSPRWLSSLVRARQSQEDAARARLAAATTAAGRAHERVRAEAARLEALQGRESEQDVQAFVAAAAATQAAASTHAAAVGDALRADGWIGVRGAELSAASLARHTAEQLQERALAEQAARDAAAAQRALDEVAATAARRRAEGRP